MRSDRQRFYISLGLRFKKGDKMNPFDIIINKYFPNCPITTHKIFDEECLAEVTLIEIKSKFSPLATANREWKMFGELVKAIPIEQMHTLQIRAII